MRYGNLEDPDTISDQLQVVYDSGELGAAQTTITVSNLDGNTSDMYIIYGRIVNGAAGAADIYLRPNNDSGANYGYEYMDGTNATATGGNNNAATFIPFIGHASNGDVGLVKTVLYAQTGDSRLAKSLRSEDVSGTTVGTINTIGTVWSNSGTNITSLVFTSSAASGLGIGSRIIVMKKVPTLTTGTRTGEIEPVGTTYGCWQLVYSDILTGASTTETISNLTGNTDVIYRLLFRHINGYSGTCVVDVRPNNDSGSNYGWQNLNGIATTVSAGRFTGTVLREYGNGTASGNASWCDALIYAKSGYERTVLKLYIDNVTGTTIAQEQISGQVWSDTSNEMTSLVLIADQTNGLGIGTHIELWRLNL